jgi:hypothetical protein
MTSGLSLLEPFYVLYRNHNVQGKGKGQTKTDVTKKNQQASPHSFKANENNMCTLQLLCP